MPELDRWGLLSLSKGVSIPNPHRFFLVLLQGSSSSEFCWSEPSALLLPGPNLSHRCRSAGEAGALLLLPEVAVFQPSRLLMGVFISQPNTHRLCLPLLWCSWGFTFLYLLSDVTQNMQSVFFPLLQMLHSRLTSSSRSLTW